MSANALALLTLVNRSLPPEHPNGDEYARRVPVGPARDVFRALISGDEDAVIDVPLTLRLSVGDLNRLLACWTGNDDDVVGIAERAIRARLNQVGESDDNPALSTGEPEVAPDWDLGRLLEALRRGEPFPW
jgi:hypothetical protein